MKQGSETTDKVVSYEQFRTALELVVSPSDPREFLVDLEKIGEGSTGIVYTGKSRFSHQYPPAYVDIRQNRGFHLPFQLDLIYQKFPSNIFLQFLKFEISTSARKMKFGKYTGDGVV